MTQYTAALKDKMVDQQQTNDKMRYLWNIFRKLKETDFDINVKKFKENPNGMNLDDWFKDYVKGARADIDDVTRMVQLQAKENGGQKKSESKQMLFFFNQLVEDSAGIRKILLEIQMTLKSKDSSRVSHWPIDA